MAPISEERSGSVWVDGAAKDGNGSALSILENPKSPSRFRPGIGFIRFDRFADHWKDPYELLVIGLAFQVGGCRRLWSVDSVV